MANPRGTNTRAFSRDRIVGSINASQNAHMRRNNQLSDIARIFDELNKEFANCYVPNNIQREILQEAAAIGVTYARQEAPVAEESVKIYNTAKVSKKFRAPKGKGTVRKIIRPGNLPKNIKVYTHGKFKKINSAVFYGPKYPQAAYAHILEFGSKFIKGDFSFMKPAFQKAKGPMLSLIKFRYKDELIRAWDNSVRRHT